MTHLFLASQVCALGVLHRLLLAGLGLHLLHLDRVWLAAAHVQLVVAHAQRQDALVNAQPGSIKHKVLEEEEGGGVSALTGLCTCVSRPGPTGDFLSMGLMTNFLSLKEMLRISLHGKPIFGVSLHQDAKQV